MQDGNGSSLQGCCTEERKKGLEIDSLYYDSLLEQEARMK